MGWHHYVCGAISIVSVWASLVSYSVSRSMNSFSSLWTFLFEAIAGRISSLRSLCFFIPCNLITDHNFRNKFVHGCRCGEYIGISTSSIARLSTTQIWIQINYPIKYLKYSIAVWDANMPHSDAKSKDVQESPLHSQQSCSRIANFSFGKIKGSRLEQAKIHLSIMII